jgi:hypothetical protein
MCYSLSYSVNSESARIAEDEPEKVAIKSKWPLFPGKGKEAIGCRYSSQPNLMFPVSRRELAPASRDI